MDDNILLKTKLLDLLEQRFQKDPGFFVNKSTISVELGITEEEAFRYADYLVNNKWAKISEPQSSRWRIMINEEGREELKRIRNVIVEAKKNIKTENKIKNSQSQTKSDIDYLIKKFEDCLHDLKKCKETDEILKFLPGIDDANEAHLLKISKHIRNLLKVGYEDGKERANHFTIEGGNFYRNLQNQVRPHMSGLTNKQSKFLQNVRWHEIKVSEFLDELKLHKDLSKNKSKKSLEKNGKKSSDFQTPIKKLNKIQDKINHAFDYADLSKNNEVIDISEELYSLIEKTFPDGKSRIFKLQRQYEKVDREATDYYADECYSSNSDSDGIYKYTHRKLLEFFSVQVQKTINEIMEFKNSNANEHIGFEETISEYLNPDIHADPFFKKLILEINKCYSSEMYGLAIERTRKIFENLLIDVLKKKYPNEVSLYKGVNNKHHRFHLIVQNTRKKIQNGEFDNVKEEIEEVLEWSSKLRTEGGKSTHSITFDIDKEYLDEIKPKVVRNTELLIRILNLIK